MPTRQQGHTTGAVGRLIPLYNAPERRLHHAASGAKNGSCAGADAQELVKLLLLQCGVVPAPLLDERSQLARRDDVVHLPAGHSRRSARGGDAWAVYIWQWEAACLALQSTAYFSRPSCTAPRCPLCWVAVACHTPAAPPHHHTHPAPRAPHLTPSAVCIMIRSASPCFLRQGMMDTTTTSRGERPIFLLK